jgi:hypothetical protein
LLPLHLAHLATLNVGKGRGKGSMRTA